MSEKRRFAYQISWRTLMFGSACLASCLVLLLAVAWGDGLPSSWLWWTLTVSVALSLGLALWIAAATKDLRPIEIVVSPQVLDIPAGLIGTRRESIELSAIRGLRLVGRATTWSREATREVLYVIHGDAYAVIMSEMFESLRDYTECRDAILDWTRVANPQVRIDIDGNLDEAIHGIAKDPDSSATESSA